MRERIIDGQFAALDRLEARDFAGTLMAHVNSVLSSPRREHPPVAFDFWDQAERAEEFDEIKYYRPAAFQALPRDPASGGGEPAAE
jgi:hypothetical protein